MYCRELRRLSSWALYPSTSYFIFVPLSICPCSIVSFVINIHCMLFTLSRSSMPAYGSSPFVVALSILSQASGFSGGTYLMPGPFHLHISCHVHFLKESRNSRSYSAESVSNFV